MPAAARGAPATPRTEVDRPVAGGTETLLVVEDEEAIRNSLATHLSRYGYNILFSVDGADGLEVFRRERDKISLILLDLSMPRMSGYEFLPIVRSIDPEVKVILVTGHSIDDLQSVNVRAIVQNSYRLASLALSIREVLDP